MKSRSKSPMWLRLWELALTVVLLMLDDLCEDQADAISEGDVYQS
ncbi:MAG: hypothetical protein NZ730_02330 [Porticoccaceae bacterium]|nr:hypothetical protein [Porticoccaceae bacterium]